MTAGPMALNQTGARSMRFCNTAASRASPIARRAVDELFPREFSKIVKV